MLIGMQSSKHFNDYNVFLRAMGTALSALKDDTELTIITSGPNRLNEMVMEFTNISERTLRSQGVKVKVVKMPPIALKERIHSLDTFLFFSLPKEPVSDLVTEAEDKDIDVIVYRYA